MEVTSLSAINRNYFNQSSINNSTQTKTSDYKNDSIELTHKKKKLSNTQKLGIAFGVALSALGGLTACALLTKSGKFNPANFEKHIDFKPAQTMEEAKDFAKKHFKIERFELDNDLEVANWVNEGLTNINNTFSGKAHLPVSVSFKDNAQRNAKNYAVADINIGGDLRIDRQLFNTEDTIKDFRETMEALNKVGVPQGTDVNKLLDIEERLAPMLQNPSQYSKIEWMKISQEFEDVGSLYRNPMGVLSSMWENPKTKETLIESGINLNLREIFTKSPDEKKKILDDCIAVLNKKYKFVGLQSKDRFLSEFDVIYHEMGHLQNWGNSSIFDIFFGKLSNNKHQLNKFTNNFDKQQTAGKVSWYAQTSPQEFVAEVFAQLCNGRKPSLDILELYKHYNGVLV